MARKHAWGPQARRFQQTLAGVVILTGAVAGAHADTLLVPVEYVTIQAAIDAAIDGDTVLVADGTYTGPGNRDLDFGGKAITVRSENGPGDCISGPGTCIDIQGSNLDPHRAFHFHTKESDDSVVEGFTIINGWMNTGGAMLFETGSAPTITGCSFENNTVSGVVANTGGGAAAVYDSQPTFSDCEFSGNLVNAVDGDSGGGAVYAESSNVSFTGCDFDANTVVGGAGGAIRNFDNSTLMLDACNFTGNSASKTGAVLNLTSSEVTAIDCTFDGNFTVGGNVGALTSQDDSTATLDRCQFIENNAACCGAVLFAFGGTAVVTDCTFVGNVVTGAGGGALVNQDTQATFINTVFLNNTADFGGGVEIVTSPGAPQASFVNCVFAQNSATGGGSSGGAIDIFGSGADVTMANCTFTGNSTDTYGGAINVSNEAQLQLTNSVLWGDSAPIGNEIGIGYPGFPGGTVSVSYSDVQGGEEGVSIVKAGTLNWGAGNIDEDPLFIDDYRVAAGSPGIDAADNTAVPKDITTDLDGNPRFIDDLDTPDTGLSEDGCPVVDMGAFEFQEGTTTCCPADFDGDGTIGASDLAQLLGSWGPYEPCPPFDAADFNEDCGVNAADLAQLLGSWGPCE